MPLTTRTFKLFYFQRSILSLSHRHLLIKFHHCVLPQCLEKCSRDDDCNHFLPWLENKAGMEISSVLSVGKSKYGRSLFACKNIKAGDCLLKVPFNVQISADNMLPQIIPMLSDEVGIAAKLAAVILVEQRKGQDSEWAPYINCLPQPGELHSTIFWSEHELEMVRQSSVYQETVTQQAHIRKNYSAIKPVLDFFPNIFGDVTFEDFRHAYAVVGSRAWGSIKGLSLIPFADFLNHDGTSKSVVLSDEHRQISEVIADRNYVPGEEVLIRYGKFPNSTLLLDFGFTVPYNIYDEVCIQVDIPSHDPLRAMKMDLLHRLGPKIKDASFSSSGGSFVIKKVRSARGKGKGIPQSLRAFARVLCCTSSQALNDLVLEATQNDGRLARRPLINRSLEIQAHRILLSLIDELIEKYNVSIKSLLKMGSINNCSTLSHRQQMARDLLTGEVDVLKSASAWLKHYCYSCQEQIPDFVDPQARCDKEERGCESAKP